jgi:Ca2+-binding EF-hand superfamily protein
MIESYTSVGSYNSANMQRIQQSMFKKLDVNSDGKVDRSEFVSAKPDSVSEDAAGSLFDRLDTEKSGSLTQTSFASGFEKMASSTRGALLHAQAQGAGSKGPDQDQLGKLDTDGDGTISRDEFIAGRPDEVSEDQAGSLFDSVDTEKSGSLSSQALAEGMKARRPHGPPPGGGDPGQGQGHEEQSSLSTMLSKLDTDGDGKVSRAEFLAGKPEEVSSEQAGSLYDQFDTETSGSVSISDLAGAMASQRPKGPPLGLPPQPASGSDSASGSDGSATTAATASASADSMAQEMLSALFQQYQKATQRYGSGGQYASLNGRSVAMSV